MAVQLIKDGAKISIGSPMRIHEEKFLCVRCDQAYTLHYSPGEEHRLKDWIAKAGNAVNESHPVHPDTVNVSW